MIMRRNAYPDRLIDRVIKQFLSKVFAKNSGTVKGGGVQDDGMTEMAIFMYGNWTENGKLEVKLTKNRRKINFEPKSVRRRADFALFW